MAEETKTVTLLEGIPTILSAVATEMHSDASFQKVRIYGTIDNPLFIAKDVQELLGVTDLHYYGSEGAKRYEPDVDIQTIRMDTRRGIKPTLAFTELGLQRALHYADTPIAKKFRVFVHVVLKRLFQTGQVKLSDVPADYEKKIAELTKQNKIESAAAQYEHDKVLELTARNEILKTKITEKELKHDKAMSEVDHNEISLSQINAMIHCYATHVQVMLCKPQNATLQAEFDYNFGDMGRDISTTDTYIFALKISNTPAEGLTRMSVATVYLHPKQSLDALHECLAAMGLCLKKPNGDIYPGQYAAPLDEIVGAAQDLFNRSFPADADAMIEPI